MQTQLICSDIDGTLLNKERELSERTKEVIKSLSHIPFILISSRMPQAMEHLQNELDISHLPLICYNGGYMVQGEKVLHSTEINIETSKSVAEFCLHSKVHCSLYHGREWYVEEMDYWAKRESHNTKVNPELQSVRKTLETWEDQGKGAHKIMCMGEPKELDELVDFINNYYKEEIIGYRSKPTYLEISPRQISKKTALETLMSLEYPEINLEQVMAFGDNYNDIDMLRSVGIGVAVENGIAEAREAASFQTTCNIDDGVAVFMEKNLVLSEAI